MPGLKALVSGYATLDYVVHAVGTFAGTGTMLMATGPDESWPRAGGAALYAGVALAAAGHDAAPLSWIGDDADGQRYLQACRRGGVATGAVAIVPGASSTRCLLIYHRDGSHGCLLRPGAVALSPVQLEHAASCDLLVIAAGDPVLQDRLLDALGSGADIAWIAKADPASFPEKLCRRLAARARWVFCNQAERGWIDTYRPAGVLFETRGAAGVAVEQAGTPSFVPAAAIDTDDATGAGDTFAGATLGALLHGVAPAAAAEAGVAAAGALLRSRMGGQVTSGQG